MDVRPHGTRRSGATVALLRRVLGAVAAVLVVLVTVLAGASAAQAHDEDTDGMTTLGRKELVRVVAPATGTNDTKGDRKGDGKGERRSGPRSVEEFARIDTGAARSSIDTDLAQELGLDLDDAETIEVKSSLGKERRPLVRVTLQIDGRSIPTRVTVNDRSDLSSKVLIGRHDLDDGFLVDVSRTHLTQPGGEGAPSATSLLLTSDPLPPSPSGLLAGLALGATLVVAMRQLVGVHTFGTFAPVLLALAYVASGLTLGLLLTVVVCGLAVAVEPLIRRLRLPRVSRLAVLIGAVTMVLAGNEALLGSQDTSVVGAAFPVVVLAALVERFWECREEDGLSSALTGWVTTVAVAVLVSLLLVVPAVRTASETHPLVLAAALTATCILVGRYRGLRLSELVRFRAAAAAS